MHFEMYLLVINVSKIIHSQGKKKKKKVGEKFFSVMLIKKNLASFASQGLEVLVTNS